MIIKLECVYEMKRVQRSIKNKVFNRFISEIGSSGVLSKLFIVTKCTHDSGTYIFQLNLVENLVFTDSNASLTSMAVH